MLKPSDCRVSATEAGVIVPVELLSRTEKDSRNEFKSGGGSRDKSSPMMADVLTGGE